MIVINAKNVHLALHKGLRLLSLQGLSRDSRNGRTVQFAFPVTTVYEKPKECVVFWPERDANPFFHFFEALWMLAGRNDVAFPASFAKQINAYSDDGHILHGAYGHRWRHHFLVDQLGHIITALKTNPHDRRQVLEMWDAQTDLTNQQHKKDVPCNTQAFFSVSYWGALDMTVTNRSNDMIWGAYGANAVHFSYLQQFIAEAAGYPVGTYYQVSNNLHVYDNELYQRVKPIQDQEYLDPYAHLTLSHAILGVGANMHYSEWLSQCESFLVDPIKLPPGMCFFFRKVARPLFLAHFIYKDGGKDPRRFDHAIKALLECRDSAWQQAGLEWLERRQRKLAERNGVNDEQNGS